MTAVALYTVWMASLPWMQGLQLDDGLQQHYGLVIADPAALHPAVKVLVSLHDAILGIALLFPLWMLHRLGRCFRHTNVLGVRTSMAVRHLAHSILAGQILLQALAGFFVGVAGAIAKVDGFEVLPAFSGYDIHTSFLGVLTEILAPLVVCITLYSLAWLIRIGAEAADDARGIV
ncbi:hypothetical protein CSC62_16275 [Pseudoxanthomonas jiangsuensis]|nr:hypothetical protein CSC62_16275 [Pseudoxanthomonas jiangsuensis]